MRNELFGLFVCGIDSKYLTVAVHRSLSCEVWLVEPLGGMHDPVLSSFAIGGGLKLLVVQWDIVVGGVLLTRGI